MTLRGSRRRLWSGRLRVTTEKPPGSRRGASQFHL